MIPTNTVIRGIPRSNELQAHVVDADAVVFALPPGQRSEAVKAAQRLRGSVFVTTQGSEAVRDTLRGLACVRYAEPDVNSTTSGALDTCRSLGDAVVKAMRFMDAQPGVTAFVGHDQSIVEQFGMGRIDPATVLGAIAATNEAQF